MLKKWIDGVPAELRLALGFLALVLAWCAGKWALAAAHAAVFPFGLDYAEGVVWQQARLMFSDQAYGPIERYPATVFEYAPLYHAVVAWFAAMTGADGLLVGRLVTIASTLAACLLVRAIVIALGRKDDDARLIRLCASFGGGLALATRPVLLWSALMRVDMLFVALSLGGVLLALRAVSRPALIHLAALLFVAAIFTKQTAVAAPAAVFGGFLRHIVLYNLNRLILSNFQGILGNALLHAGLLIAAIFALFSRFASAHLRPARDADDDSVRFLVVAAYWAVSGLVTLTFLKAGSGVNYFVEWSFATAILAAVGLSEAARRLRAGGLSGARLAALRALPWVLILQVAVASAFAGETLAAKRAEQAATAAIVRQIELAEKPVIADDMVALLRAGQSIQWEPFIFGELARAGLYDERPFLARIEQGQFAFFVTEGQPGDGTYESRFDSAVDASLRRAYPDEVRLGNFSLHYPKGAAPANLAAFRSLP